MNSDDRRHRNRFGRALFWGGAVALLVVAAALLPERWLAPIRGLFGGDDMAHDAFSDPVAGIDRALERGEVVPVSRRRYEELRPRVQVRRLLAAGRMTGEEVRRAQVMLEEFAARERAEQAPGSREAVRALRDRRLAEAFPRLDPQAITRELEQLRRQLDAAEFAAAEAESPPGATGLSSDDGESSSELSSKSRRPSKSSKTADCIGCHSQTRALPPGRRLEVATLWPRLDESALDVLEEGRVFPVLLDGPEFRSHRMASDSVPADGQGEGCLSCHRPHGAEGFEVTLAERQENLGLWLNPLEEQGLIGGQVKVQNRQAAHRIPGGYPEHGYALVVTATQGGRPLQPWWGPRLPQALRGEERVLGQLYARRLVGPEGAPAGRHDAVDILSDTRLQPGRFSEDFVLFRSASADEPWEVVATLYWLPDQRRWEGAVVVEQVTRRAGE